MQTLDPRLDVVFKMLLLRNEEVLRSMIEAILTLPGPIERLTVLNPEILKEEVEDKGITLDVRVELGGHGVVDSEMQSRMLPGTTARFLYSWAREFGGQLAAGAPYTTLHPVYAILWLGENLHAETPYHSRYRVAEDTTGKLFSNHLQIHTLELRKLLQSAQLRSGPDVDWGRFLTGTDEERTVLAARSPAMKRAHDALHDLSRDPDAQRIALQRERNERASRHLFGSALQAGIEIGEEKGRKEGIEIGEERGLREALFQLAASKFGALSDVQTARIEEADAATLKRAFGGLLRGESLEAALEP